MARRGGGVGGAVGLGSSLLMAGIPSAKSGELGAGGQEGGGQVWAGVGRGSARRGPGRLASQRDRGPNEKIFSVLHGAPVRPALHSPGSQENPLSPR